MNCSKNDNLLQNIPNTTNTYAVFFSLHSPPRARHIKCNPIYNFNTDDFLSRHLSNVFIYLCLAFEVDTPKRSVSIINAIPIFNKNYEAFYLCLIRI